MTLTDKLMNKLFGPKHFRVKYTYSDKRSKEVFSFYQSVIVFDSAKIDSGRLLKKAVAPMHKMVKVPKYLLRNGTLSVEPTCYLGRWK